MFIEELWKNPRFYWAVTITVVISVCLHELAHGLVSIWFGDRTPIEQHRLSPNPLVHMGVVSIICLLVSGIAWGSMPIDRTRLRGRYAEALVALAGPTTNVLIALISLGVLAALHRFGQGGSAELGSPVDNLEYLLWICGYVNFGLAMFNLIPVPPLDGSHILANLSHPYERIMRSMSTSGGTIMLFILVFSLSGKVIWPAAAQAATRVIQVLRGY